MLLPFRKKLLPVAPSAVNVLWRSLVAHQRYDALAATPLDHVMRPPLPDGLRITEFERHSEIFQVVLSLGAPGDRRAGSRRRSVDRGNSRDRTIEGDAQAGTITLPIGHSAMPASFRCAQANGSPMMVTAHSTAVMR